MRFRLLAIGLSFAMPLVPVQAQVPSPSTFAPDVATVKAIESRLHFLPSQKLEDFDRYYTERSGGRKMVTAVLMLRAAGSNPELHLVDEKDMPAYDHRTACGVFDAYI